MQPPPRAVQLNEANAFLKEHPEVQYVDLLIADMNGVVRGKRIERASLHKVYEKGINLPASLFALDINGITVESTGLGMDIGDSDRICFPHPQHPQQRALAEAPHRTAVDDHARARR